MSVAVTSLPVPLSPMTRRNSNTARIRALRPTTMESKVTRVEVVMASSAQPQGFELRHLLAKRRLYSEIQRHVRAWTAGAHARQPHVGGVPVDVQQLDIAAVGLHERPNSREHRFDPFSSNHVDHQWQLTCHRRWCRIPGGFSTYRRQCGPEAGVGRGLFPGGLRKNSPDQDGLSSLNFSTR